MTPSTLRQSAIVSVLPSMSQRRASCLLCTFESRRLSLNVVGHVQDGWGHLSIGTGHACAAFGKAPRSSVQQVTQMSVLQLVHVR